MVTAAGGRNVLGAAGERSVPTTWRAVADADPHLIVSAPCGFALADSVRLGRQLVDRGQLPPEVPVWAVDANASFARPGPRLVDGIEALAAIFGGVPPDPAIAVRLR
jgi:iron complex transport system substrate-binding protein